MIGRGDDLLRSTRRVERLPHKALAAGEAREIVTPTRGGRSGSTGVVTFAQYSHFLGNFCPTG